MEGPSGVRAAIVGIALSFLLANLGPALPTHPRATALNAIRAAAPPHAFLNAEFYLNITTNYGTTVPTRACFRQAS